MSDDRGSERTTTRRQALRLATLGTGAILAGCSGTSGEGAADEDDRGNGTTTNSTSIDGGGITGTPTAGGDGEDAFTPWQWWGADPGRTYATPDPAPESLEVTATYQLESGGGGGAAPAVTDAGVFLLGTSPARIDTAGGSAVYSRSVNGDGQAFVQDGILVVPHAANGRIIGYRASDGERTWVAEPGPVVPFPTGDGVGYVNIQRLGVLDPENGETRWETTRGESGAGFTALGERPWVVHSESGTLYGGRWDSYENRLLAVEAYDAATGERRWRREDVPVPFAVHKGMLLTSFGESVVALDRTSGEELWRGLQKDSDFLARYAVDDDGIYVWTDNVGADVVALDPATGEERWRKPFTGRLGGTVATGDAIGYRTSKKLRLLSKDDGSERLSKRDDSVGAQPMAAAGGKLYVTMGIYANGMRVYGGA